jgi:flagellar hook assembly protein FlgD
VRVRILDISGNLVKTLLDGKQFVGNETISVEWDGTDDYNQPLKSGVYIYQIESDGIDEKVINGTIVIVR